MRELILQKLEEIERRENIRILYAVESGSRAWGFPSRDSDYDVRFIYVRPLEYYLKLDKTRDVIDMPVNEMLDITGWDLKKALQLLYSANPTLYEWTSSPIVYRRTDFIEKIQPLLDHYFSSQKGLYHYLGTAERNYQEFLTGDMVRIKKYFYVLRPVLACRWILEKQTPPPMLFSQLAESQLPQELRSAVEQLLDLKMNTPEVKLIPRVEVLSQYLEASIPQIREAISQLPPSVNPGWEQLEQMFCQMVLNP